MIRRLLFLLTYIFSASLLFSQDLPDPMSPPRLFNDFVGILNVEETQALEQKLLTFNNTTSTQIYVIVVSTTGDYAIGDYAQRIGEKWGIGQKGKDNGAVMVIVPKTKEHRGKIFIATGYGLEGVIPDAIAKRIVEHEFLPVLKNDTITGNRYAIGINRSVDVMMKLASQEYSPDEYYASTELPFIEKLLLNLLILTPFVIMMFFKGGRRILRDLFLGSAGSLGGVRGRSGGRGFRGGGGGSFGGGGAGGSW
ncbi:MAG TPA: TPM domain-containing protein [Salinivirgaceae bacterium]|nr:TPM domain-containing protein [Salinivirgaceae bacterium]